MINKNSLLLTEFFFLKYPFILGVQREGEYNLYVYYLFSKNLAKLFYPWKV